MKSRIYIIFLLLTIGGYSCIENTSENIQIPIEFKDNKDAVILIKEITHTTTRLLELNNDIIKITGDSIKSTQELTTIQMLKLSKPVTEILNLISKTEDYKQRENKIKSTLSKKQTLYMDSIYTNLIEQIRDLKQKYIELDK